MADSTGDGSNVSLEHDEPECTATPCWSSSPDDVDGFLAALPEVVGRLRRLR